MKKIALLLFLIIIVAANAFSQTAKWDTLSTDDGELTFALPSGCYTHFYNRDGIWIYASNRRESLQLTELRIVSCYRDGALLNVEMYDSGQAQAAAKTLRKSLKIEGDETKIGKDFYAVAEVSETKDYTLERRVVAGKKRVYLITAAARRAPNETMRAFLDSLKFNDLETARRDEKAVSISALENTLPEVVSEKDADAKTAAAPPFKVDGAFKKIIALSKPAPSYTNAARQNRTKGTIFLRLTFGAEGKITRLQVLRDLPNGLVRETVIAALRIKFLPAELDGKPVSTEQTVVYSFGIY